MTFSHFMRPSLTRSFIILCLAYQLPACSDSGVGNSSASVTWEKPDFREDGTTLLVTEIAGYHIYYGPAAGDYQDQIEITSDGSATETVTVDGLATGATYYLVITTYDTEGHESMYSREIQIPL